MKENHIYKLQINQLVKVKPEEDIDGFFMKKSHIMEFEAMALIGWLRWKKYKTHRKRDNRVTIYKKTKT